MPVVIRSRLRRVTFRHHALRSVAQHILNTVNMPDAELSLEIVGDHTMRGLNRRFRRIDRTTDVLAFPMREAPGPATPLLGDVVIAFPRAEAQAMTAGHSTDTEFVLLLIHGILHLAGYDHERSDAHARRMHRKERDVRTRLGTIPSLTRMVRPPRARRNNRTGS